MKKIKTLLKVADLAHRAGNVGKFKDIVLKDKQYYTLITSYSILSTPFPII